MIPTDRFGERMKKQMEERLKFLESGEEQSKNEDVMAEVVEELKKENLYREKETEVKKKKKKDKKRKAEVAVEELEEEVVEEKPKKKKKTVKVE